MYVNAYEALYIYFFMTIYVYTHKPCHFGAQVLPLPNSQGKLQPVFFCVGRRVQRHGLLPMAAIEKPPAECRVERIFARGGESNSQAEASKERNGFEMLKLTQQKAHVKKMELK